MRAARPHSHQYDEPECIKALRNNPDEWLHALFNDQVFFIWLDATLGKRLFDKRNVHDVYTDVYCVCRRRKKVVVTRLAPIGFIWGIAKHIVWQFNRKTLRERDTSRERAQSISDWSKISAATVYAATLRSDIRFDLANTQLPLDEVDKRILEMRLDGHRRKEIVDTLQVSKGKVRRVSELAKKVFRDYNPLD